MAFQPDPAVIRWRIHLSSSPGHVYGLLASDTGRASFWAKSAIERDGAIEFVFPGGQAWRGKILERRSPVRFVVEYYGGSIATFELLDDGRGGTDLTLIDAGVPNQDRSEVTAGWVSVLMALKAAADFGIDLRNHDAGRTWEQSFVDN
jgi:hypothetical protein